MAAWPIRHNRAAHFSNQTVEKKRNLDPFFVLLPLQRALAAATTWFTIAEVVYQPQVEDAPSSDSGKFVPVDSYQEPEQPIEIQEPVFDSPISTVNVQQQEEDQEQVLQEFVPVQQEEEGLVQQLVPVVQEEAPIQEDGLLLSTAEEPDQKEQTIQEPSFPAFPNFQQQFEKEFQEPVLQIQPQLEQTQYKEPVQVEQPVQTLQVQEQEQFDQGEEQPVEIQQQVQQPFQPEQQGFDEEFENFGKIPQQPVVDSFKPQGYDQEFDNFGKVPVQQYQEKPVEIPEEVVQISSSQGLDEVVPQQEEPQQSFQIEEKLEQQPEKIEKDEKPSFEQPQPFQIQKEIEQFAQSQTNQKLGGGVVNSFQPLSANKQAGRARPTRPPRPQVVQEPVDNFFLRGFPEVAQPEGGDVPLDEQAAIREAIFELKKERRSG